MKSVTIKSGVAIGSILLLAACSGGGTSSPVYKTFNAAITGTTATDAPVTLGGVALRSNNTTGALDVTTLSGSIDYANAGSTALTDGTLPLTDSTGFSPAGVLTDGTTTLTQTNTPISTTGYAYVIAYSEPYSSAGGVSYDSKGFVGVVTAATDMPTTGTATYSGTADVTVTNGGVSQHLSSGTSSLVANFAASTADLTLNGFTYAGATPLLIDKITATGMSISGNSVSGGTFGTALGTTNTSITGTNTTGSPVGNFYGYNGATSAPAEVAGVVLVQGNSGKITGAFIGK